MVGNRLTDIMREFEFKQASPSIVGGVSSNMSTKDWVESMKAISPILVDNNSTSIEIV